MLHVPQSALEFQVLAVLHAVQSSSWGVLSSVFLMMVVFRMDKAGACCSKCTAGKTPAAAGLPSTPASAGCAAMTYLQQHVDNGDWREEQLVGDG